MHVEQVLRQMREMRLSQMATALEEHLRKGDHRDLSHEEFLALLIEEEYTSRKNRKLTRSIVRANFRSEQACIENLRYSPTRGLSKRDITPYLSNSWIENRQNIIITGPTGTGKTYLAEAIGLRACMLGNSVLKIRYRKLLDEIATARGTGTFAKYVTGMEKLKVLIIDDFVISPADKKQSSDLLELLDDREQRGSLIITSQYAFDEWHGRFADPTVADAICDRLIHTAHKMELDGGSMRRAAETPEKTPSK